MKYLGKTKIDKKKLDKDDDVADYIEITDEAAAILTEIKNGFERLRLSNLTRR